MQCPLVISPYGPKDGASEFFGYDVLIRLVSAGDNRGQTTFFNRKPICDRLRKIMDCPPIVLLSGPCQRHSKN